MGRVVFVDPSVFILQDTPLHPDQLESRLYGLVRWSRLISNNPSEFCTSERCVVAMYGLGIGPSLANIKNAITQHGITSVDAQTVMRAVSSIVNNEPYLERLLNVEDILVDETQSEIDPLTVMTRLRNEMQPSLLESFGICAVQRMRPPGTDFAFATLWDAAASPPDQVVAHVYVAMIAFQGEGESSLDQKLPITLDVLLGTDEAEASEAGLEGWEADPARAIEHAYMHSAGLTAPSLRKYRVRNEFVQSIKDARLDEVPRLLRAVFRKAAWVVSGLAATSSGAELHWIEQPKGGPQKTRSRDDAKAWRCQISKYGAAYQLHYWECPDGVVEIAIVQPHNSVYIPE